MATIQIPPLTTLVQDETDLNWDDDINYTLLSQAFRDFLFTTYLKPADDDDAGEAAEQENMVSVTLAAGESIGDFYFSNASGGPLGGAPAVDTSQDPDVAITTVDGRAVYLHNTSDPKIAVATTSATAGAGDLVAAFYIDQTSPTAAGIQMVTFIPLYHGDATDPDDRIQWGDVLSVSANTTLEFSFDNLDSGKFLYVGVGSETAGLLVTGSKLNLKADGTRETGGQTASDAVNTSQGGTGATIGIDNQMFTPGDSAIFSLVEGMGALAATGQTTGQDVDDIVYDDFIDAGAIELFISQKQGNTKLDLTMTMYSAGGATTAAETGFLYIGTENITGNTVNKSSAFTDDASVAVASVEITDDSGNPVGTWTTDAAAAGASATDDIFLSGHMIATGAHTGVQVTITNNAVDVNGVNAFYSVKVNAEDGETFNRFELAADTGKFDIGKIVLEEGNTITQVIGTSTFTDDDGPVPSNEDHSVKVVEDELDEADATDDDLSTGNSDNDGDSDQANVAYAALATLVAVGADSPAIFTLNAAVDGAAVTDSNGDPVTSSGAAVVYSYDDGGTPSDPSDDTVSGVVKDTTTGAVLRTVFTITPDGAGGFDVDLDDQIDHSGADDDDELLSLNITPAITATDSDLDPVDWGTVQALLVDVENDVPVFNAGNVTGEVFEDALSGGNPDGDGETETVTATLAGADIAALFNVGADEDLALTLDDGVIGTAVLDKDGNAVLSAGAAVVWAAGTTAGTLRGAVMDIGDPTQVARTVFTLAPSGDDYVVTLVDQVDHSGNEDDDEDLEIDLTPAFAAEDADGDSADLSGVTGAVTVKVENDLAFIASQIAGATIDRTAGNSVSKSLNGAPGADEPAHYTIDYYEDLAGYIEDPSTDGTKVDYYIDLGNDIKGDKAFTLEVSDTDDVTDEQNPTNQGKYIFTNHLPAPQQELIFDFDNLPSGQNLFGIIPPSDPDTGAEDLDGVSLLVIGNNVVLNADGTFVTSGKNQAGSDTINTSQGGTGATIGVNNQMVDPGESLIFAYINDPDDDAAATDDVGVDGLDQNSADDADTIGYQATVPVDTASVFISQTQGGGSPSMTLAALNIPDGSAGDKSIPAEQGRTHDAQTYYDNLVSTPVDITAVNIYVDGLKVEAAVLDTSAQGDTNTTLNDSGAIIDFRDASGTWVADVSGLAANMEIEFVTSGTHDAVRIAGTGGKFDVGGFKIAQGQDTPDLDIDFSVAIEDRDGDLFGGENSSFDDFTIRLDGTGEFDDPNNVAPPTPTLSEPLNLDLQIA